MIGLFDRDVFYKLCCCDLWTETLTALGITEPYRLGATNSERSNRRAISSMLTGLDPEGAIERAQATILAVPVLSDDLVQGVTATEWYQALGDVDGIDAGEQVLAAILLRQPDGHILLSGDKRFVRAFRENLPAEWNSIKGSVVSFEACLMAVEASYGFDYVLERVFSSRRCDGSLRLALGLDPNREEFLSALASFDPCCTDVDADGT